MTLNGYDISAYQSSLDPGALPGDFVIVKATGGDGYVNPAFRDQIAKARAAGKLVGVYHFARDGYTGATAASEAAWFIQNAGDLLDGTCLAVLDWEGDNSTDVGYAKEWLDTVTAQTGVKPIIYASFKDIQAADWTPVAAADYGLWEAAYVLGYTRIDGYSIPSGLADIPYWSTRAMWQYTSSGYLPGWGAALDLDVFYGDASAWAAYAAKNGTITTQGNTGDTTVADLTQQNLADIANAVLSGDNLNAIADAVLRRACYDAGGVGHMLHDVVASYQAVHDGVISKVNAHTDAAAKGLHVTLTADDVAAIAKQVAADLPASDSDAVAAAVVKALAAKLAA